MRTHSYFDLSNLNARWDAIPLQGLGNAKSLAAGILSSGPMGSLSAPGLGAYTWGEKTDETRTLQQSINAFLKQYGYCPIDVDGNLGPATCAAGKLVDDLGLAEGTGSGLPAAWAVAVQSCEKFGTKPGTPPCAAAGPAPYVPPPAEPAVPVVTRAGMSDTGWLVVGTLVAAGAIGAAWYFKKRR